MRCFERPSSSADSDRQGLCILSAWKRQMGPGICFQLLSRLRHRLAHSGVALHTDSASSGKKSTKKKYRTHVKPDQKIPLSTLRTDIVLLLLVRHRSCYRVLLTDLVFLFFFFRSDFDCKSTSQNGSGESEMIFCNTLIVDKNIFEYS